MDACPPMKSILLKSSYEVQEPSRVDSNSSSVHVWLLANARHARYEISINLLALVGARDKSLSLANRSLGAHCCVVFVVVSYHQLPPTKRDPKFFHFPPKNYWVVFFLPPARSIRADEWPALPNTVWSSIRIYLIISPQEHNTTHTKTAQSYIMSTRRE